MPTGKKLNFKQKQEIVQYYKSKPMSFEDVSKKFGLSLPTIGKIIKEFKIPIWPKFKLYSPNFEEDYFQNIDTENKAYFLGLLITDGNIYDKYKSKKHPPNINLTLQKKDKYMLEKLKEELKVNKQVASDGRGSFQLAIFSHKMAKDLEKFGIIPNKTFVTCFPNNISKELMPHFVRGLIDGDGSISFYSRPNRKVHTKAVRMCGANPDFLNSMLNFLHEEIGTQKLNLYQEKENLWSFAFRSKDDMEKIINYIYKDANIYLFRKKELCDSILDEISKYRDN